MCCSEQTWYAGASRVERLTGDATMKFESIRVGSITACIAAIIMLLMTACSPFSRTSPEQVQASNPTVSYKYSSDDELIQTNELAATFCSEYRLAPRPLGFSDDQSGNRVVNFECVPTIGLSATPINTNLTYTYRSDQELIDVSRKAHTYCLNSGSTSATYSIVGNPDGTKTITFLCNPG